MKLKINVLNHSPPAGRARFLSVNLCAPVDTVFVPSMLSTFRVKCFFFQRRRGEEEEVIDAFTRSLIAGSFED